LATVKPRGRRKENSMMKYWRKKAVAIPAWANAIRLVANGIDGYPPFGDARYSVEEFRKKAPRLQRMEGGGEWDVLVYAVADPALCREVHPYGSDNPYRRLRSRPGGRVKQVAEWSYMRWTWHDFN
jgi:hypothetical protein